MRGRRRPFGPRAVDEALRARLRLVIDSSLDAVIGMDADGRVTEWNRQAEVIFGRARAEALGAPLSALIIPARYREAHERGLRRFLATGEGPILNRRVEMVAVDRAGRELPVELTVTWARHDGAVLFHAFVRDITERKRAHELLARQALEARLLHDATMMAAESDSEEDALRRCVDSVCALTGWRIGHVLVPAADGQLVSSGIWHLADAGDFAALRDLTARTRFAPGEGLPGRILVSGEPEWVADVVDDPKLPRSGHEIGVKGAFGFPIRIRGETAAVLEFFSAEAVPPDPHLLNVMRILGEQVGRVIERRRLDAALRERSEALRRKNEELERLVYTISHDLKSPLVTVLGFAEAVREDARDGRTEDLVDSVERIERAARRMHALVGDVLQLGRAGAVDAHPEPVDVGALVRKVADDLALRFQATGATLEIQPDLPDALADRARLEQVFENLLTNALKYGCPGPGCRVTVGGGTAGREVRYFVRDEGPGIAPEDHARIFGLFQRLESRAEGTGVGLAIVQRVVEVHCGRVWVESNPGEGATFWFSLPRAGPCA